MIPISKPWAESIENLSIKKREFDPEFHKEEWFYKDKNGNIFPYFKEDIQNFIDPLKPATFFPFLQALDIPYYEEIWLQLVLKKYTKLQKVFGCYLSQMTLPDFRCFGFNDSSKWFNTSCDYQEAEYGISCSIYRKDLQQSN